MDSALILAIIFLIPGLLAVFVPVLPAIPYLFIVMLVYGFATHFGNVHGLEWAILSSLAILGIANDHLSGIMGAKYGGASKRALLWGFIGTLVGTFLAGPIGAFIGLFVAIIIAELSQLKTHREALKAATGGVIGALTGYAINIVIAFVLVITFIVVAVR
jgi:uncharacterized protein YqgC (DUF456 family)